MVVEKRVHESKNEPVNILDNVNSLNIDKGVGSKTETLEDSHVHKRRMTDNVDLKANLLSFLPRNPRYKYSYKTEAVISVLAKDQSDSILITGHKNGLIKFWRRLTSKGKATSAVISVDETDLKEENGLECIKQFTAHLNREIVQLLVNKDGLKMISVAKDDHTIKQFDLTTLDMILVMKLEFLPNTITTYCNTWFEQDNSESLLISEQGSKNVYVVNVEDDKVEQIKSPHRSCITAIKFNGRYTCFVSSDEKGIVEYWKLDGNMPKGLTFKYRSETNLFDIAKNKSKPICIALSSDRESFATISHPDKQIRIFDFKSGKIIMKVDESLKVYESRLNTLSKEKLFVNFKFADPQGSRNVVFDNNDKVLIYASVLGLKIVETRTGNVLSVLGEDDQDLMDLKYNQALVFNKVSVDTISSEMLSSLNSIIQAQLKRRPLLIATSENSERLFVFDNTTSELGERDVDVTSKSKTDRTRKIDLFSKVTLHTTLGDIKIKVFNKFAPKAVKNFITLCQRKYYDNIIFHRVIKGFMIQTGDPLGDGTGGESAWGSHFEDEFNPNLSHSKPFMVSMANAGPNTNGSQFFITTEKTPFLDNKHTIFGEVYVGFDVVRSIEEMETDSNDKPLEQVAILSTTLEK